MKRSEAFWILNEMYELANEAQKQALNIAQRDIEFVDLMPDVPVQRWIPVTERLPEEMEKVMAFVNGVRITAVLKGGVWLSSWNHDPVNDDVTHWMPLPEPPKDKTTTY